MNWRGAWNIRSASRLLSSLLELSITSAASSTEGFDTRDLIDAKMLLAEL